jgi:rare lipoprotein A
MDRLSFHTNSDKSQNGGCQTYFGGFSQLSEFNLTIHVKNTGRLVVLSSLCIFFLSPVSMGAAQAFSQTGQASYYHVKFEGRKTASGERFRKSGMTAAHRTAPFGSRLKVTNLANGKTVVVRVNDRGPFVRGRIVDVSNAAAGQLGMIGRGVARVRVQKL